MVVNAPTSNIVTAAELAVGLLLATARHIPPANAALKPASGSAPSTPASSCREDPGRRRPRPHRRRSSPSASPAFGMKVVAYDPYVAAARAAPARRPAWSASTSCCDVRLHHRAPAEDPRDGRPHRRRRRCARSSRRVRIVNAARGGIVDEAGAVRRRSRRAGSPAPALDVYAKEPCTDSPLFELDNVVVTPHLGASTDEAQEKAGIAVARSVRLALAGELVPDAVNVSGGVIAEDVRPGIALDGEARPHLHRARRRGRRPVRRRGARRDHRARRQGAASSPRSRACSVTWSRSRCPTSTRRCSPASAVSRCGCSPTREPGLPQRGHPARRRSPTAPRCPCRAR